MIFFLRSLGFLIFGAFRTGAFNNHLFSIHEICAREGGRNMRSQRTGGRISKEWRNRNNNKHTRETHRRRKEFYDLKSTTRLLNNNKSNEKESFFALGNFESSWKPSLNIASQAVRVAFFFVPFLWSKINTICAGEFAILFVFLMRPFGDGFSARLREKEFLEYKCLVSASWAILKRRTEPGRSLQHISNALSVDSFSCDYFRRWLMNI